METLSVEKNSYKTYKKVKPKPTSSKDRLSFFSFLGMTLKQTAIILLLVFALTFTAVTSSVIGIITAYYQETTPVDIATIQQSLITKGNTKLLDKNGKLYATITNTLDYYHFVPYEEVKDSYLVKAFISIEDTRFYEHRGIDIKRTGSALASFILHGGNATHGGSTITQQVVKLITGDHDISGKRKAQEWFRALDLEDKLSKEAIMEIYLNVLPMSSGLRGVGTAAKSFFNKDVKNLTLAESALIASIPNAPSIYNPMTEYGRRNVLRRMRITLSQMLKAERISEKEYQDALNEEIRFDFSQQKVKKKEVIQSWFTEAVLKEVQKDLVERRGYTPELAQMAIYNSGLIIETTVDPEAQLNLQSVFLNEKLFVQDKSKLPNTPEHSEAGITVMDNSIGHEGEVRAIIGGFGEKKGNYLFNFATDAKRQPGSSIKPILVYAPAINEKVITPWTVISDRPMYMDPGNPKREYPQNYSRTYSGPVTVSYALLMSLNTIAADVFANYLGIPMGLQYLKEEGIDRTKETNVASALGGFEHGMSTFDMATAYSVLANEGVYHEPTTYLRVLTHDGEVLLDKRIRNEHRVFTADTILKMNTMLKPIVEASWNKAKPQNVIAAGKTGTSENYRDVWFCGYSYYYTATVWYGYPNANGRNTSIPLVDGNNAGRIWKASMETLHKGLPQKDLKTPEGLEKVSICQDTKLLATPYCPHPIVQIFDYTAGEKPPVEKCQKHKKPQETEPLPTLPPDLLPPPFIEGNPLPSEFPLPSPSSSVLTGPIPIVP